MNHYQLISDVVFSSLDIPGPEVIKKNSCSTQLSIKSKLLVNADIAKILKFQV